MVLEGIAELPLHDGRVPPWLASIMKRLARAILEVMVEEFGPGKVVERLSNPLWFQAFNNVIGMDWDSSGSTTVTTGILKDVTWRNPELGVLVLGGKGGNARRVPEEVPRAVDVLGLSSGYEELLVKASRLIAKIDSSMLQDGYTLYHHSLIISSDGSWTIIQQGMNIENRMARRYHWFKPLDYYNDPHKAVYGYKHEIVLNLVSSKSRGSRRIMLDIARDRPGNVVSQYSEALRIMRREKSILEYVTPTRTGNVRIDLGRKALLYKPLPLPKEIISKLRKIYEIQPRDMDELLLIRGVGPKTIRALALISDLIYNEPPDTNDPVNTPYDPFKYAYAIGGKDGVPYPVNRRDAEEVIETLENIIYEARIGEHEKMRAFRNLRRISIRIFGRHTI